MILMLGMAAVTIIKLLDVESLCRFDPLYVK
jgi:hypothetical protein